MKEKPILFNTEMVKAILEGRKTQTRRIVRQPPVFGDVLRDDNGWYYEDGTRNGHSLTPPFLPGDIMWVRETWSTHYDGIHNNLQYCYKADDVDLKAECLPGESNRWYPSIHMPREAARLFLKVKDVRVERLRDMNDSDLANEGFSDWVRFLSLWNSTIKHADCDKYDWNANPWVWVIEFERCEKPEGWCS